MFIFEFLCSTSIKNQRGKNAILDDINKTIYIINLTLEEEKITFKTFGLNEMKFAIWQQI